MDTQQAPPAQTASGVAAPASATASNAASASNTSDTTTPASVLLARSLMHVPPREVIDSRRSSVATDDDGPLSPSRPRTTSRPSRSSSMSGSEGGDVGARHLDELNDMMGELHRNQLWFTYVFASTRESFESNALAQASSVRHTLDELTLALEVVKDTKKRMVGIQQRVEQVKNTVGGWRQKQINEEKATAAAKEAKAAAAAATAAAQQQPGAVPAAR